MSGLLETKLYCRVGDLNDPPVKVVVRHTEDSFDGGSAIAGRRIRVEAALGVYFGDQYEAKDKRYCEGFSLQCYSSNQIKVLDEPSEKARRKRFDLAQLQSEELGETDFITYGRIDLIHYGGTPPALVVSDGSTQPPHKHAVQFRISSALDLHTGMVLRLGGRKKRQQDGTYRYVADYLQQLNLVAFREAPRLSIEESIQKFQPDSRIRIAGQPVRIMEDGTKYGKFIELKSDSGAIVDIRVQRDAFDALAFADPSVASRIAVTGVTSVRTRHNSDAAYELTVAQPEDIELLESRPQVWRTYGGVLIGVVMAFVLAWLWTKLLKRRSKNAPKSTEV